MPSVPRKQGLEYPKIVVFGHLDINSLQNKFVWISELIKGKADIFLINETKLDESFQGFKSFQRFEWDGNQKYGSNGAAESSNLRKQRIT